MILEGLTYVAEYNVNWEIPIEEIEEPNKVPPSWPDNLCFKGQGMEPICKLSDIVA